MPKLRLFLRYWGPVLLMMALVFSASGDRMSFNRSSRIIAPLVRWLVPGISDEALHATVVTVRKLAHFTEFCLLYWLVWRALRKPRPGDTRPWDWPLAARGLLLVIAYAATDELHQMFTPSRQASLLDVLIDTAGAVFGLILLRFVGRWRGRW